jgi:hypothetical protein
MLLAGADDKDRQTTTDRTAVPFTDAENGPLEGADHDWLHQQAADPHYHIYVK